MNKLPYNPLFYFIMMNKFIVPCQCGFSPEEIEKYKKSDWETLVWAYNGPHFVPISEVFVSKQEAEKTMKEKGYKIEEFDDNYKKLINGWLERRQYEIDYFIKKQEEKFPIHKNPELLEGK